MTSTPVGMRCPECARDRTRVRDPAGAASRSDAPATYVLVGICVAAFVAEILTGGSIGELGGDSLSIDFGLFGPAVAEGEPYRIVTYSFLHAGLLHLAFNAIALYVLGTLLEPAIGTWRLLGIYAVSVLGGAFGALLLDPNELTVGASGGVFGLMAAGFLIARDRGLDQLASQIGFFVILNLFITFAIPGISIGGHIGGLVGGGVAALLYGAVDRRRPANPLPLEAGALLALCAIAVAGSLIVAESSVPGLL
jgi:membrane associated rhomboid family serine protease